MGPHHQEGGSEAASNLGPSLSLNLVPSVFRVQRNAASQNSHVRLDLPPLTPEMQALFSPPDPDQVLHQIASERQLAGFFLGIGQPNAARQNFRRISDLYSQLPSDLQAQNRPLVIQARVQEGVLSGDLDRARDELSQAPQMPEFQSLRREVPRLRELYRLRRTVEVFQAVVAQGAAELRGEDRSRRAERLSGQIHPLIQRMQEEVVSGRLPLAEAVGRLRREAPQEFTQWLYQYDVRSFLDQAVRPEGDLRHLDEAGLALIRRFVRDERFAAATGMAEGLTRSSYVGGEAQGQADRIPEEERSSAYANFLLHLHPLLADSNRTVLRNASVAANMALTGGLAGVARTGAMPFIEAATQSAVTRGLLGFGVHAGTMSAATPLFTPRDGPLTVETYLQEAGRMMAFSSFMGVNGLLGRAAGGPSRYALTIGGMTLYDLATDPINQGISPGLLLAHTMGMDLLMRAGHVLPHPETSATRVPEAVRERVIGAARNVQPLPVEVSDLVGRGEEVSGVFPLTQRRVPTPQAVQVRGRRASVNVEGALVLDLSGPAPGETPVPPMVTLTDANGRTYRLEFEPTGEAQTYRLTNLTGRPIQIYPGEDRPPIEIAHGLRREIVGDGVELDLGEGMRFVVVTSSGGQRPATATSGPQALPARDAVATQPGRPAARSRERVGFEALSALRTRGMNFGPEESLIQGFTASLPGPEGQSLANVLSPTPEFRSRIPQIRAEVGRRMRSRGIDSLEGALSVSAEVLGIELNRARQSLQGRARGALEILLVQLFPNDLIVYRGARRDLAGVANPRRNDTYWSLNRREAEDYRNADPQRRGLFQTTFGQLRARGVVILDLGGPDNAVILMHDPHAVVPTERAD